MEEIRTNTTVLLLTLTLTLLHFPATTTSTTSRSSPLFSVATQALTDSGFLSMSLTLRLASPSLPATATSATIFAPSDATFRRWGPLPLSLLQYHILPSKLPLQHLTTLPFSTPLPTLLPNYPLTVTTSAQSHSNQLSLNNRTVSTTPLCNNPSLLILPLNGFFNSSSLFLPEPFLSEPIPEPVIRVLNSNDRYLTAAILQARLFSDYAVGTKLTVFAPPDEAVRNVTVSASDDYYYSAILRKHVVPKLITWRDLIRLPGRTLLPTFSDGFVIRVGVSPRLRLLNGVAVTIPDMYRGDSIVVHGVDGLLNKEENR